MQARQNPMAIISQRFNIPQNIQKPQDIVQHLLDSGQISQDQLNNAMRMKNSPQLKQFMK
jgi:sRNA-binding protein